MTGAAGSPLSDADVEALAEALLHHAQDKAGWQRGSLAQAADEVGYRLQAEALAPTVAALVAQHRAEERAAVVERVETVVAPQWHVNRGYEYDTTSEAFSAGRNGIIDKVRAALADPTPTPSMEA